MPVFLNPRELVPIKLNEFTVLRDKIKLIYSLYNPNSGCYQDKQDNILKMHSSKLTNSHIIYVYHIFRYFGEGNTLEMSK